jgi:hypothetical protein
MATSMERYLVELTGDQLERLSGMVREAIEAAGRHRDLHAAV